MVELIPQPDPHALLPPLLACLPTAFASSRPPPALLSLLSPILKQRLSLITSHSDDWLRLLCWNKEKANTLHDIIENTQFEPHPSSGEIEVGDIEPITYKRFDSETLRAQIALPDWDLTALYLWYTSGDDGSGWRLSELLPYDQKLTTDTTWSRTISEANESYMERLVSEALDEADAANRRPSIRGDDDDYWAQYDKPSSQAPALKKSPAPNGNHTSDADYYAQYANVQPAFDNHDPSEEMEDVGESSLGGNALSYTLRQQAQPMDRSPPPYEDSQDARNDEGVVVNQPVPSSPSSRGSDTVARLEKTAQQYADSEVAIRQHISTSMKSMYRLARSSGMDREEFDRIVQRELETLSIFDRDE
jgi:hypothetical protein